MKIVTLTLSPAYDLHICCDSFAVGKENLATITSRDIGGKGINISRALSAFGAESTALVCLGSENCEEFEARLNEEKFNSLIIRGDGRIRENITLHAKDGETRISFDAPQIDFSLVREAITKLALDSGDVLTVTGRMPEGVDIGDLSELLSTLAGRGVKIVIDSKSFTLDDISYISPWLIKPNAEEISHYLGRGISDFSDLEKSATEIEGIKAENILVSLGESGAVLFSGGKRIFKKAPSISAISTIGAGDSMIAGFIYAYCRKEERESWLGYAIAFGSAACLTEGTSPPKRDDIEKFL